MVVDKELSAWEAALALEIARVTGQVPVQEKAAEKVKAAPKKKFERKVVLGISNDRGHTITEFTFESKAMLELPAEMEARRAAKAKGLNVHSVISNVRLK